MPATVTVIVCVYNGAQTLEACLHSVAEQDYSGPIELIVVDDGSTDDSRNVAETFASDHPETKVIHQANAGLGASRNRALAVATGDYVAFLDADDLLPPTGIRLRVEAMERHDADLVVGRVKVFPGSQRWTAESEFRQDLVIEGLHERPGLLISTSSLNKLFKRSFFDSPENLFAEGVHFEDIPNMTAALLTARRIAVVSDVCYLYHREAGSGSIMDGQFERTKNYFDHLDVNALLLERFTDDEARDLLIPFVASKVSTYMVRAPQALPEPQLTRFFERCVAEYGELPPELAARGLRELDQRVAFAAVMAGDRELFDSRSGVMTGGVATEDGVHVTLKRKLDPHLDPLLEVDHDQMFYTPIATFTVVKTRFGRRSLELSGTVSLADDCFFDIALTSPEFSLAAGAVSIPISVTSEDGRHGTWTSLEHDFPRHEEPRSLAPVAEFAGLRVRCDVEAAAGAGTTIEKNRVVLPSIVTGPTFRDRAARRIRRR
jgi:glycosyltransferase involved in cell wall biosynthesis